MKKFFLWLSVSMLIIMLINTPIVVFVQPKAYVVDLIAGCIFLVSAFITIVLGEDGEEIRYFYKRLPCVYNNCIR